MTSPAPSPESTKLAAVLRELKDRTGLSLAGLAARTTFSKSSWERYLNGRTLPPRQAVQELCRLADEPDGRCLALRELAKSEWSGPPRETPPPPIPPPGSPAPAAGHRARTTTTTTTTTPTTTTTATPTVMTATAVLTSVSAALFAALLLTLLLLPHQDETTQPSASAAASPSPTGPHCRDTACEGKDPAVTRCGGDPETLVEYLTSTGASAQLRYSRVCGTTWVRMWGTRIGDGVELRGRVARVRTRADADTYVHTPMTATRPGTVVQGCFLPANGGKKECFKGKVD
ncbi:XRE family transcriptional regulator [Streptomyces sp. NBC_01485]|uniref:helix-turn-helix domain-containing protein n=1 Tax=Streptomyces sp. NBC_01485 TaxID=2903884 RepID=UPI002E34A51D|nr:helix-turn-helix domain-containing protein [Streptomyces sp. NBC_01485]